MDTSAIELDIVKRRFRDFYYGELAPSKFDRWLCTVTELENRLGKKIFLQLIDLDYSNRDDVEMSRNLIQKIYNELFHSDICRDKVREVLKGMLECDVELAKGCKILWKLSLNGANFIPPVFAGYALELENPKWELFYWDRSLKDIENFLKTLGT